MCDRVVQVCERKLEQQAVVPPVANPRCFSKLLSLPAASRSKPSRASKLPDTNGIMNTTMRVTRDTKLPSNTPSSENLFPRDRPALESSPEAPEPWANRQPSVMVGRHVAQTTRLFL